MVDFKELRETVDSDEEVYFIWWLEELKKEGIIQEYERADTFTLSDKVDVQYEEVLKTKTNVKTKTILNEHVYTPDFKVIINKDSPYLGKFFVDIQNVHEHIKKRNKQYLYYFKDTCFIETKGNFDSNNMTRLFGLNQKWLFQTHGLYTNLVKLPMFFKKTFYPERYLLTDVTLKPRKINGEIETLKKQIRNSPFKM